MLCRPSSSLSSAWCKYKNSSNKNSRHIRSICRPTSGLAAASPAPSTAMTVNVVEQQQTTKPVTLVSFDVDGTLIHSTGKDANKLHKECFSAGFKEVFGLDTHIDIVPHHGGTDPLIVIKVLEHHGIPKAEAQAKLKQLEAAMLRHFQQHAERAGLGLQLLPGVKALLEALQVRLLHDCYNISSAEAALQMASAYQPPGG
eukprot:GHRQ01013544.1.p1 GENE.GHRQ01013544.1~~GHRQ01013544.1.p1  ORF type:complete len:200 (+),score=91.15 GHRQ01013544.1:56-655(+)